MYNYFLEQYSSSVLEKLGLKNLYIKLQHTLTIANSPTFTTISSLEMPFFFILQQLSAKSRHYIESTCLFFSSKTEACRKSKNQFTVNGLPIDAVLS